MIYHVHILQGGWGDRIRHHSADRQKRIYRELLQWPAIPTLHHQRGGAWHQVPAKDSKGNQGIGDMIISKVNFRFKPIKFYVWL